MPTHTSKIKARKREKPNKRLLRRVQKAILEEPLRIWMSVWASTHGAVDSDKVPTCGTVACIYGWAKAIDTGLRGWPLRNLIYNLTAPAPERDGARLLGLTEKQVAKLFFVTRWPDDWQARLGGCKPQTAQYAQTVSDYIDFFVKTVKPKTVKPKTVKPKTVKRSRR